MDPIEQQYHESMNRLAKHLGNMFPGCGFCLLVFKFGGDAQRRMNYISNANRDDMLVAMREFIAQHEGRMMDTPEKLQ